MRMLDVLHRHRAARSTAAAVDDALSGQASPPAEYLRSVELARSLARSFRPEVEPPREALVAVRAGVALRQQQRSIPERRRVAVMLAATAAIVVLVGGFIATRGSHARSTLPQAQQALSNLNRHVQSLQSALDSGDAGRVQTEMVAANDAATETEQIVRALPDVPGKEGAVAATDQQVSRVDRLVHQAQLQLASKGSVAYRTTTTTSAVTSTTTAPVTTTSPSTTTAPTTTGAPPPTTTEAPSTTEAPTSTSEAPTSTSEAPTSTTQPESTSTTTPSPSSTTPQK